MSLQKKNCPIFHAIKPATPKIEITAELESEQVFAQFESLIIPRWTYSDQEELKTQAMKTFSDMSKANGLQLSMNTYAWPKELPYKQDLTSAIRTNIGRYYVADNFVMKESIRLQIDKLYAECWSFHGPWGTIFNALPTNCRVLAEQWLLNKQALVLINMAYGFKNYARFMFLFYVWLYINQSNFVRVSGNLKDLLNILKFHQINEEYSKSKAHSLAADLDQKEARVKSQRCLFPKCLFLTLTDTHVSLDYVKPKKINWQHCPYQLNPNVIFLHTYSLCPNITHLRLISLTQQIIELYLLFEWYNKLQHIHLKLWEGLYHSLSRLGYHYTDIQEANLFHKGEHNEDLCVLARLLDINWTITESTEKDRERLIVLWQKAKINRKLKVASKDRPSKLSIHSRSAYIVGEYNHMHGNSKKFWDYYRSLVPNCWEIAE